MKRLAFVVGLSFLTVACSSKDEKEANVAKATGALGGWTELPAMPVARANHCVTSANGYLVVIGGNYKPAGKPEFVTLADVHVAKIQKDGSLGAWSLAGKTKSPVTTCTATSDGKDVYLVDGIFDDEALGGHVQRATVADDGTIAGWDDLGVMPNGARVLGANASVANGELRALRSRLPDPMTSDKGAITFLRAKIENGTLGAWEETSWLEGFRGYPQLVFADSYVFALGGYATGASNVLADGAGALLDANGRPGASFAVTELPKPTTSGRAVFVDGWVFVLGGKDKVLGPGAIGRADGFAAKVANDGTIGAWQGLEPMPEGRTSHAVVVSGEYLYVVGGGYDAGGLDTVFAARVRM